MFNKNEVRTSPFSNKDAEPGKGRRFYIPISVLKNIRLDGISEADWTLGAVGGLFLVNQGLMYQKQGDEYNLLNVSNFSPYPISNASTERKTVYLSLDFTMRLKSKIKGDLSRWKKQAVTFGVRAPNLNLYVKKDGEFKKFEFIPPKSKD